MADWSTKDIPSQNGKIAVITGATGGLGLETALGLAGAGAEVVVTGRNPDKGAAALRTIRAAHPARRRPLRIPRHLEPRSNPRLHRALCRRDRQARHPRQQCRRHGAARAPRDRRRLRTAVRHQLSRPLRAHGAAPAAAYAPQAGASFPSRALRLAQASIHFDDLQAEKTLPDVGRLRAEQARLPDVRPRTAAAQQRRRLGHHQRRSRIPAFPAPTSSRTAWAQTASAPASSRWSRASSSSPPPKAPCPSSTPRPMPERRARRLLRSRRLHGAQGQAEARDARRPGARRGGRGPALGDLGAAHVAALPASSGLRRKVAA